ncbi:MAG TPA: hydroxymethylbilane synthase [Fibrobacteria bacterium]|nr:hydroxymethylbilane synthase [Fibrobacteria bacterium]
MTILRAGTRGSQLAWTQSGQALELLAAAVPGATFERVRIETRGDKDQHTPLSVLPGTGLFVKELESALVRGEIDLAIHSLKDVPFETAPGCQLFYLEREDPRDALISPHASLEALPEGALVGTGSPRRIAQLKAARPDLRFQDLRGNLETRLRRLDAGEYDAIVLACAGLSRLGWEDKIRQRIDPGTCVPAFGQGILALECRGDRPDVAEILRKAEDPDARLAAETERTLMKALGGGCKTALAALAEPAGNDVRLRAVVGDHHTGRLCRREWTGPREDAATEAHRMARDLRQEATALGFFPVG